MTGRMFHVKHPVATAAKIDRAAFDTTLGSS